MIALCLVSTAAGMGLNEYGPLLASKVCPLHHSSMIHIHGLGGPVPGIDVPIILRPPESEPPLLADDVPDLRGVPSRVNELPSPPLPNRRLP